MFSMSTAPWHNTPSTQRQSLAGLSAHRQSILVLSTQQHYWDHSTTQRQVSCHSSDKAHYILYSSNSFVTDYPGRPREHGNHPQLPEYILSSGSFGTIAMGSQVELPYRVSDNKQLSIFSFCSGWWGGAFSHVFLSSRWSGGSGGFCKILSFNRWSQYAVK